ncbi:MAG: glucose-1-phosphate adenylyltransferase, partial [Planctomycetota bacterium]|nr:glucose-1-phosphate adenylyltransferase [Planctomycetota bacterium]
GAVIENSVIGLRCHIGRDVVIRDSIIMGNDSYQTNGECNHDANNGRPPLGIGSGTFISRAIVDKDCRIGRNVRIENASEVDSTKESNQVMIRDGIVVVSKDAVLPDGWTLQP